MCQQTEKRLPFNGWRFFFLQQLLFWCQSLGIAVIQSDELIGVLVSQWALFRGGISGFFIGSWFHQHLSGEYLPSFCVLVVHGGIFSFMAWYFRWDNRGTRVIFTKINLLLSGWGLLVGAVLNTLLGM